MNCAEFEAIVVEVARVRAERPALAAQAEAHAAACETCRTVLDEQRRLDHGLQALAAETARETPVVVRARLRAEFQKQHAGTHDVPAVPRRTSLWLWPAAAVLLAGVAWLMSRGLAEHAGPATVAQAPALADVPARMAEAQTVSTAPEPLPRVAPLAARVPRSQTARRHEPRAVFEPLLPGDRLEDLGSSRLVRVGLPRAALVSWGWPLEGDVAEETVEADVLVGEDGVARAIRVAY